LERLDLDASAIAQRVQDFTAAVASGASQVGGASQARRASGA
jgi:hypothetical protein